MSGLPEQIALAKKTIRAQKKSTPWLFREYHTLQAIRERMATMQKMLEKAEREWKELGR